MRFVPVSVLVLCAALAGCGSKGTSPTSPSTPATPTATKIIRLGGSMDFGGRTINTTSTNTLTVYNDGNSPLSFTGLTGTGGITAVIKAGPSSGTVPAGGKLDITISFTPTAVASYSGTIGVTSDAPSGTSTINFAGHGTLDGISIFTKTGTGNTVFDMPSYVSRVRVQGSTPSSCQNFIVKRNGPSFVNVILGTCSVADVRSYDGTHLVTGGGVIEIVSSEGVNWTFTEIR